MTYATTIPDDANIESYTVKNEGVTVKTSEDEEGTVIMARETSAYNGKSDRVDIVPSQHSILSEDPEVVRSSANMKNEEAVFRMSMISGKTPVALLQEQFDKQGIVPQYNLVMVDGKIHQPVFQYRVAVGQLAATGCGQSKQKAKQSAAKSLLGKLIDVKKSGAADVLISHHTKNMLTLYDNDDGIQGNPVGMLQEMCRERMWRPPTYLHREEGLPHQRRFTMDCVLGEHSVTSYGSGKSKKLAKRQAANEMIKKLKEFPMENGNSSNMMDEDELAFGCQNIKSSQEIKSCSKGRRAIHSQSVSKFHRNLQVSQGENLFKLQFTNLREKMDMKCVDVLEDIGTEQQFMLTFVDIENISKRGLYQCMVQLCLVPVAVCFGEGETRALAKEAAARDALDYLKLMTGKTRSPLV